MRMSQVQPSVETRAAHRRRIVVVDADPALFGLLATWLADDAEVVAHPGLAALPAGERCDLLVVDVPFPRLAASNGLQRLAEMHPGTPVLALSPTFFGGIASQGAAARSLGVAAVLPKPVARDALLGAVRALLGRSP